MNKHETRMHLKAIESAIEGDQQTKVEAIREVQQALTRLLTLYTAPTESAPAQESARGAPTDFEAFMSLIPKSQHDIVSMLIEGVEREEIARRKDISLDTLNVYIRKFYAVAGVHSKEALYAFLGAKPQPVSHHDFTPREREVARLVSAGETNRAIAKKLELSESTLSNYLHKMYRKVGVRSRDGLLYKIAN